MFQSSVNNIPSNLQCLHWRMIVWLIYFIFVPHLVFFSFTSLLVESSKSLCSFTNINFDSDELTTLEILNITSDFALPCIYLFPHQMNTLPFISYYFSLVALTILFKERILIRLGVKNKYVVPNFYIITSQM